MSDRQLRDYTEALRMLCGHMLAGDCSVYLDAQQFDVLRSGLEEIDGMGDVGFQLERCEDLDPGHSLSWDNVGTPEQDKAVDDVMDRVAGALFYGRSGP